MRAFVCVTLCVSELRAHLATSTSAYWAESGSPLGVCVGSLAGSTFLNEATVFPLLIGYLERSQGVREHLIYTSLTVRGRM